MNATLILKAAVAATGVAIATAFAGAGLAAADPTAGPTPETTLTVQDGGSVSTAAVNGASIDGDGTQGKIIGPLEIAKPQIKADASTAKDGS